MASQQEEKATGNGVYSIRHRNIFFSLFCLHQPYYNEKIFFFFFSFLCLFLFAGVDDVVVYSHIYTMMQYRRRQQQDFLCWEGEKNGRKKRARGAPPVVYYIVPDLFFSGSVVRRRCLFGISLSLFLSATAVLLISIVMTTDSPNSSLEISPKYENRIG